MPLTRLVFFLLAILLSGCTRPDSTATEATLKTTPSPPLDLLVMPVSAFDAIERIELKSLVRDTADGEAKGRLAEQYAQLASRGIRSSGYFKYFLHSGGGARVKLNTYVDRESQQADWQHRYPADIRENAQYVEVSSDGFHLPGQAVVFAPESMLVEITSFGGLEDSALIEFAERYARHLHDLSNSRN